MGAHELVLSAYACATIDHSDNDRGVLPRVRHLIHRSLLSTTCARPLLVSTTDVRTPKVSQLYSSISGSRSGCVAELAWWIEEAGEQYRIAADTYVMPKPGHDLHGRLPFEKLGDYSEEVVSMEERMQWWERERVNTFDDKMGDILRASFVRPEPGSVLVGGYKSAMEWPERLSRSADVVEGSKEAEQVTEALSNFALLVFRPYKVERIELGIVSFFFIYFFEAGSAGMSFFAKRFCRPLTAERVGNGKMRRRVGKSQYLSPRPECVIHYFLTPVVNCLVDEAVHRWMPSPYANGRLCTRASIT